VLQLLIGSLQAIFCNSFWGHCRMCANDSSEPAIISASVSIKWLWATPLDGMLVCRRLPSQYYWVERSK
jgi:hypothetical protein